MGLPNPPVTAGAIKWRARLPEKLGLPQALAATNVKRRSAFGKLAGFDAAARAAKLGCSEAWFDHFLPI